ncbi:MAG: molybdenum ABC transporter ATP-binding protein [Sneathiella sp.]|nr:molybdenum ABC transporter ATP-binding protein [Sneathiella sp.]
MTDIHIDLQGVLGDFSIEAAFAAPTSGVTAIFGPSGCGKTSILRAVAGLNSSLTGLIQIGEEIWQDAASYTPPHKRAVGYVFQEASLFPHLSVIKNIGYGMKRSKKSHLSPNLDELTQLLGISDLLDRMPNNLSGGEKQRVAIARALLSSPEILLMDEPMAALGQDNKNEILPYLEKLHKHLKIPIFYVTHDMQEVERLADHLILMENGKVRAYGKPADLISDPSLPFQKRSGAAAILDGVIRGYDPQYDLTTIEVAGTPLIVPGNIDAIETTKRLRIKASDVGLSLTQTSEGMSYLNNPLATIISIETINPAQEMVKLQLGKAEENTYLLAAITRKSAEQMGLQPGQTVSTLIKSISFMGH